MDERSTIKARKPATSFRWLALFAAAVVATPLALSSGAQAAEPQVPNFWDAKEPLPKPDLAALPRLRFLTTTGFPPFNFLDAQGRLSGFHVDLARAICAELELTDRCEIQALPWDELDEALRAGDGEAILAGIAVTAQSREDYAFSRPYLHFPARFVMLKARSVGEPIYEKLAGKRVGVLAGTAHERMLRTEFEPLDVATYDKPETLRADLKDGAIDAIFGDGLKLSFWLDGTEATGCCRFVGGPYLAPDYFGQGMAIAVKPQDTALAAALDYALQQLSLNGVSGELYLRYFPVGFY